ncbi:MAG: hypothetical protein WAU45_15375 [Blastocatellia bacterium]
MYRTDRSSAPLGLALFFLSLAIVPVSLRVAGYDVSVSPSLSAAVEAWRGIAGVLGNTSQPVSESELALVKKYSFAEETTPYTEQPVVTEACSKSFEAGFDADLESSWVSSEPGTASAVVPVVQRKARARARRSPAISQRVVLARLQRTIAAGLPALARTALAVEAKPAKCPEREAARIRIRELVRRSLTLREGFKTVQLQKDLQVFVRMRPIALYAYPRTAGCDGEQLTLGEPATEVFPSAGPRFGVGASEEPELFEF